LASLQVFHKESKAVHSHTTKSCIYARAS